MNAFLVAVKGSPLHQLMSVVQPVQPPRSALPVFISSIITVMKTLWIFAPASHQRCALAYQSFGLLRVIKSLSYVHCGLNGRGTQEEGLALRLKHLLVDTQHSLQKHMDRRTSKHTLLLKDLMQMSIAWAAMFSCSQEPHLYAFVPHLFNSGSTLQFSLYKMSSVQVTPCSFTLGQGKGTKERERGFLIPKSTNTNTTFADGDHGSFFLLYSSLNLYMLCHPIHFFFIMGSRYHSMIMTKSWR